MFVRYSFVLARNDISVRTIRLCDHALSMPFMRSVYFLSAFRHLYSSIGAFAHYVYSSYTNLIQSSIVFEKNELYSPQVANCLSMF